MILLIRRMQQIPYNFYINFLKALPIENKNLLFKMKLNFGGFVNLAKSLNFKV